jgi:hypothetical protein
MAEGSLDRRQTSGQQLRRTFLKTPQLPKVWMQGVQSTLISI